MAVNRGLIARARLIMSMDAPISDVAQATGAARDVIKEVRNGRHWKDIDRFKEPVLRYATRKASALRDTTPGTEPWLGLNIPVKEKLRMAISEYFA